MLGTVSFLLSMLVDYMPKQNDDPCPQCSDRINPHALIWEMVAFITSHETQTVTIDTSNSFSFKCEQGYANRTSH